MEVEAVVEGFQRAQLDTRDSGLLTLAYLNSPDPGVAVDGIAGFNEIVIDIVERRDPAAQLTGVEIGTDLESFAGFRLEIRIAELGIVSERVVEAAIKLVHGRRPEGHRPLCEQLDIRRNVIGREELRRQANPIPGLQIPEDSRSCIRLEACIELRVILEPVEAQPRRERKRAVADRNAVFQYGADRHAPHVGDFGLVVERRACRRRRANRRGILAPLGTGDIEAEG